jgi:hypothetical protein
MKRHRVLFINDLHVGSVWGLWPMSYVATHGQVMDPSDSQKTLYRYWVDLIKKTKRRKIDTIIANGDTVDGPGYKSRGREQMSADMMDQVMAAADLVRPLLKAVDPGEFFVISGTDYHSASQQDSERQLAAVLDGVYCGLGPHDFMFGGTSINVAHGTGGSYWYRGTKMDKIGFAMMLNIASEGIYNAKHLVRGHFHYEGHLHYRHQDMYISPCWQAQTAYMRKKDALKMVPDIGALELTIEGDKVTPLFYQYPHPLIPKVEVLGYNVPKDALRKRRRLEKW